MKDNEIHILVVGLDIVDEVKNVFRKVNLVNQVNPPILTQLGNFKAYLFDFEIPEEQVIRIRKKFMNEILINPRLSGFYEHGDWMHIMIMKKVQF